MRDGADKIVEDRDTLKSDIYWDHSKIYPIEP